MRILQFVVLAAVVASAGRAVGDMVIAERRRSASVNIVVPDEALPSFRYAAITL